MDDKVQLLSLEVPPRDSSSLTFASADSKSINNWLQALPKTNLPECSKQLCSALAELATFNMSAQELLTLVELFRPVVYYVSDQISRNKLSEGILLEKEQQKFFILKQQLHESLLACYKAVIQIAVEKNIENNELLGKSLHRIFSDSCHLLLLVLEHYRNLPKLIWLEAHQLLQFAEQQQLEGMDFDDPQTSVRKLTIIDQYKRMLLLSHSRSNQLQRSEIRQVYKALCLWAPHAKLLDSVEKNTWFIINTKTDQGLSYSLSEPDGSRPELRSLNTRVLSAHLKKVLTSIDESKPGSLSAKLLEHLASAWSAPAQRHHIRHESSGSYHVSYGSSAVHYYLSDKTPFDDMVKHSDTSHAGKSGFLPGKRDVWDDAHDAEQNEELTSSEEAPAEIQFETSNETKPLYPSFSAEAVNTSASGICLELLDSPETRLLPGELVAINENINDQWLLGAVRWVHADAENRVQFGAELLGASTRPCAIAPLQKSQETSLYQRAFLLPVIPAVTDQPTLITPRIPFSSGMKFMLLEGGKIRKGQLLECVETTSGYSQYEFRLLENAL